MQQSAAGGGLTTQRRSKMEEQARGSRRTDFGSIAAGRSKREPAPPCARGWMDASLEEQRTTRCLHDYRGSNQVRGVLHYCATTPRSGSITSPSGVSGLTSVRGSTARIGGRHCGPHCGGGAEAPVMSCSCPTTPPAPTNETRRAPPPRMIATKSARKPSTMIPLAFVAGSAASPVSGEMPSASSWLLFSSVARIRPTELRRAVVPDSSRLTRPSKSLACSTSCWISANSSGFNCANVCQGSAVDSDHYQPPPPPPPHVGR